MGMIPTLRSRARSETLIDRDLQIRANQIADDYVYIVKRAVIPFLGDIRPLKIRELRVLAVLHDDGYFLSAMEVAETLRIEPATVTRSIDRLIENNMATRGSDRRDHRRIRIRLTDEGKNLARKYNIRLRQVFEQLARKTGGDMDEAAQQALLEELKAMRDRTKKMKDLCARLDWG